MPRKKRTWFPGAAYHIISRGNRKSELFRYSIDYKYFLSILKQTKNDYPFKLMFYCLMRNHIHLQIKTEEVEIWKIMKKLNLFYAKYFNNRYNLIGHLFQGRYHSNLIEDYSENLTVIRYIHLNPVEAAIVSNPARYRWSSYAHYLGLIEEEIIDEELVLSYYNKDKRKKYKKYVESEL